MIDRIKDINIWKKILVFSFVTSLIINISITFRDLLKKSRKKKFGEKYITSWDDKITEFSLTFISAIISYTIVYIGLGIDYSALRN